MATIPSLALIPSGVKASKVYSVLPTNGTGDFDFTRSGNATRVNSEGLIELVSTNVPRLNYPLIDGVVQGCPSLLLEPQRINLLERSEEFENAYWTQFQTIPTANNAISPSGTLNADLITSVSGATFPSIRRNVSAAENTVFTLSSFLKQGTATNSRITVIRKDGATGCGAVFNLATGVISNEENLISSSIIPFPNGWFRCIITFNSGLGASDLSVRPVNHSRGTIGGNEFTEGRNLYLWGAQLEAGSYPTSYIPTSGTTATRSAETCNNAGDVNTFNGSEGVLFAEISALANDGTIRAIAITDGSVNNIITIRYWATAGAAILQGLYVKSGTEAAAASIFFPNLTVFAKIALSYQQGAFKFYVNGALEQNVALVVNDAINWNTLQFNIGNGTQVFYGNTKQLQYFPTALNDTDLETLTSWDSFSDMATSQLYTIE